MISRLWKFISYWYFRYMLVTELYMVEPWERKVIHFLFAAIFLGFWYFNYSILLSGVTKFVGLSRMLDYTSMSAGE